MALAAKMDACYMNLVQPLMKLSIQLHRMNPATAPTGDLKPSKLSLVNLLRVASTLLDGQA